CAPTPRTSGSSGSTSPSRSAPSRRPRSPSGRRARPRHEPAADMSPRHDVGLAALIVNYNTGSYAECCIESLLHEWRREGRARDKLSIVLVDNASPVPQEEYLKRIEALGVEVIRADDNLGYARGMNLAYAHTQGAAGDVVAILNPDLHFLPGTVGTLLDYVLDNPRVGVVDPATSVDPL